MVRIKEQAGVIDAASVLISNEWEVEDSIYDAHLIWTGKMEKEMLENSSRDPNTMFSRNYPTSL
jgi:hypothetical protein